MVAWSMEVLLEPMEEVYECLGSQVEEARLDRWTSVGPREGARSLWEVRVLSPL